LTSKFSITEEWGEAELTLTSSYFESSESVMKGRYNGLKGGLKRNVPPN